MNNQIWLILIGISVVVLTGFLVSLIIELKKTVRSLNDFLKTADESLKPALEELQGTLKSLKNVSSNVEDVTTDIKVLSSSVRDVGLNVKQVSGFVENIASTAVINVSGLKAGIKTGLMVLLNNLFSRKGGGK